MSAPLLLTILLVTLLPNAIHSKQIKALVTPITKHSSTTTPTSLFSISLHTNPNRSVIIDLSAPTSWLRCHQPTSPVPCRSLICSTTRSTTPSCPTSMTRKSHPCTCSATLTNPLNNSSSCSTSSLSYTTLSVPSTDGHTNLATVTIPRVVFGCAPSSFLSTLPNGTSGLATLSRSPLSIPSQLSVPKQFSICLPSTDSSPGVAFFGSGPYFLLPPPGRNITALLQFTPFIKPPVVKSKFGYYIGVKGVAINGQAVKLPTQTLRGGVQLSTVAPYTAMRSDVYSTFVRHYALATSGIPRAKKFAPFDLCLNTSQLGSTRVGPPVPQVDLQLSGGKNWTMFGANTFKQVADDVACLAFVDGGKKAEPSVVIGSFQIENNFLVFDLEKSRLGFSSLLFFFQTTCSNFNFTSGV